MKLLDFRIGWFWISEKVVGDFVKLAKLKTI